MPPSDLVTPQTLRLAYANLMDKAQWAPTSLLAAATALETALQERDKLAGAFARERTIRLGFAERVALAEARVRQLEWTLRELRRQYEIVVPPRSKNVVFLAKVDAALRTDALATPPDEGK